ncbi:hypothetical protein AQUCO_02600271v1 [Aquilegia coerulea]|uniref:HMA domain-containing protein n=1 Tax=Aquilegia coerulea TaxID=218851 RepID=A0A2G5D856_AQUCA|nr:hypothetical protein AQUCO_02600271v1 [Aquilegia coerulea]
MLSTQAKDQVGSFGLKKSSRSLLPLTTSLASIESLSMPQVHEIVISADLRCVECQKKVCDVISRTTGTESMVVNISEKKVILTYKSEVKGSSSKVVATKRTSTLKLFRNFLYMIKS